MAGVDAIASVIGIASFGITLSDGIKKAKEFRDAMKEAPDDMQYALKELEILKLVLEDIRNNYTNSPPIAPTAESQCLKLCRDGVEMLEKLVQDLNNAVEKRRRFGGAKVVLKKETIKKLQDQLGSAQRMLLLCRQTFAEAQQTNYHKIQIDTIKAGALDMQQLRQEVQREFMQQLRQEVQREFMQQLRQEVQREFMQQLRQEVQQEFQELKVVQSSIQAASLQTPAAICAGAVEDDQKRDAPQTSIVRRGDRSKRKNDKLYFRSRIRMPLWFSHTSRTWDLAVHEIPSGWKHVFRQYYTIGWHSPIFTCVSEGDVEGARELFASKRATPFDRTPSGITLLNMAAFKINDSMCSLLLEEGADPNESVSWYSLYPIVMTPDWKLKRNTILRQVLPLLDDFCETLKWRFYGNIDEILFLLRLSCAYWRHLPSEMVMNFFLKADILYKQDCSGTVENVVNLILGGEKLDERLISMASYGVNLLYASALDLAHSIGRSLQSEYELGKDFRISRSKIGKPDFEAGGSRFCPKISAQMEFVLRLITSRCNIHKEQHIDVSGNITTILQDIIIQTFKYFCRGASCCIVSTLPPVARVWLTILYEAEIDLVQYGGNELQMLSTGYRNTRFSTRSAWRLLSFTYGPTPEDWEFRLVHYTWDDEYYRYQAVQQFWHMAENPERNIPGAWGDDFDDTEYDWVFEIPELRDLRRGYWNCRSGVMGQEPHLLTD
ncbi:hypothetical protein ACMFMG_011498 [Clarireedia jacksonii]